MQGMPAALLSSLARCTIRRSNSERTVIRRGRGPGGALIMSLNLPRRHRPCLHLRRASCAGACPRRPGLSRTGGGGRRDGRQQRLPRLGLRSEGRLPALGGARELRGGAPRGRRRRGVAAPRRVGRLRPWRARLDDRGTRRPRLLTCSHGICMQLRQRCSELCPET